MLYPKPSEKFIIKFANFWEWERRMNFRNREYTYDEYVEMHVRNSYAHGKFMKMPLSFSICSVKLFFFSREHITARVARWKKKKLAHSGINLENGLHFILTMIAEIIIYRSSKVVFFFNFFFYFTMVAVDG